MSNTDPQEKRPRGRPAGSGAQLPARERTRKSRSERAQAGATRLDFTVDAESANKLFMLQEHWQCTTRKETIERALDIVYQTIIRK